MAEYPAETIMENYLRQRVEALEAALADDDIVTMPHWKGWTLIRGVLCFNPTPMATFAQNAQTFYDVDERVRFVSLVGAQPWATHEVMQGLEAALGWVLQQKRAA